MTEMRMQERFRELLRHHQARCGRSIGVVAELAGISESYLIDLLRGRRWRIHLHGLRRLCLDGWQLSQDEGRKVFALRIAADPTFFQRRYLTSEVYWELAQLPNTRAIGHQLGIDPTHAARIVRGRSRPTLPLLWTIYTVCGLDQGQATRRYAEDISRALPKVHAQRFTVNVPKR